jgi:hypothetical protein
VERRRLLELLESPGAAGVRLSVPDARLRARLLRDASGDTLDACLCALQAAWALLKGAPLYGLPEGMDPVEGWILGSGSRELYRTVQRL